MDTKRKFNKIAYDEFDMCCKLATVDLMNKRKYNLIGDINTEYYKKYDLAFKNELGNIIKIENEFRSVFDKIKNVFKTVHIPIRKKNTECDYYFIWGNNYEDLAIINKETFNKFSVPVIVTDGKLLSRAPFDNKDIIKAIADVVKTEEF